MAFVVGLSYLKKLARQSVFHECIMTELKAKMKATGMHHQHCVP